MLVRIGFNCIWHKVVSMADPSALKPTDHPFACLLLLENGIDGPNIKASLSANIDVWMIKGRVVADTAADSL